MPATRIVTSPGYALAHQEKTNWCWAAVASNVALCHAARREQCNIAAACLPDCSDSCAEDACNKPYYLELALKAVKRYGAWQSGTLSQAEVMAQLDAGRPVGVRIAWPTVPDGHFVLIVGYGLKRSATRQGRRDLRYLVFDPELSQGLSARPAVNMERKQGYRLNGSWAETILTY